MSGSKDVMPMLLNFSRFLLIKLALSSSRDGPSGDWSGDTDRDESCSLSGLLPRKGSIYECNKLYELRLHNVKTNDVTRNGLTLLAVAVLLKIIMPAK